MRGSYTPYMKVCPSGLADTVGVTEVINYKCSEYSNTAIALVEILSLYKQQGKRGVIYANRNVLKRALQKILSDSGFTVEILDGSLTATQKKKDAVHKHFLDNELDVLITNITTGKDLPCDFIIFYELTFDYKQMVGRGERGLEGKNLDIYFILTDSLYEMRYFYANVYQRGLLLERLCGKDMPELHVAVKQLEQKLESRGLNLADLTQD